MSLSSLERHVEQIPDSSILLRCVVVYYHKILTGVKKVTTSLENGTSNLTC
jgi:hypothetical protein